MATDVATAAAMDLTQAHERPPLRDRMLAAGQLVVQRWPSVNSVRIGVAGTMPTRSATTIPCGIDATRTGASVCAVRRPGTCVLQVTGAGPGGDLGQADLRGLAQAARQITDASVQGSAATRPATGQQPETSVKCSSADTEAVLRKGVTASMNP